MYVRNNKGSVIMSALFGPAGNSDSFSAKYKSSVDAPKFIKELGIDAYEYQCGKGVSVSDNTAFALFENAENSELSYHFTHLILYLFRVLKRKSVTTA